MPPVRRNLNGRRKRKTRAESKVKVRAERKVKVRAMNPIQLCGKGTSVTQLYRVEEIVDHTLIHHLVFFDRHGWYCEHGSQCSAVKDVQKFTRNGRHGD